MAVKASGNSGGSVFGSLMRPGATMSAGSRLMTLLLVALLGHGCAGVDFTERAQRNAQSSSSASGQSSGKKCRGQDAQAAQEAAALFASGPEYVIGPLDSLNVFVWRSPELSTDVSVRPDGRISTPLVDNLLGAGKTPSQLAADIEEVLSDYIKRPKVTVIVTNYSSTFDQQVRVLGEAQRPVALPYQAGMTVLDVMVAVGGLTEFAAGNRSVLIRGKGINKKTYKLKLANLLRKADVCANRAILPGDVILIPETIF